MSSVVDICNLALSHIGKKNSISSIDEASAEARACRQFYELARDTLLEAHPWRFAQITRSVGQISNDKPDVWTYAYTRPTECLKFLRVVETPGDGWELRVDHLLEGDKVYCNIKPAYMVYTARVEDTTRFPPSFVHALSRQLAVFIAMPLTQDPRAQTDAWNVLQQVIGIAQNSNAFELPEMADYTSEFVRARR